MKAIKRYLRTAGLKRLTGATLAVVAAAVCGWTALRAGDGDAASSEVNGARSHHSHPAGFAVSTKSTSSAAAPRQKASEAAVNSAVDAKRVADLENALTSGSVDDQIEAVKLFGKIGTPQQRAMIGQVAADRRTNIAVRLAAIENMDWNAQLGLITQLMRSDPAIGEDILYIASEKQLSPQCVDVLTQSAVNMFPNCNDGASQLAVLHFLVERDADKFDQVASHATVAQYSPSEYQEFVQLIEARKQEQQFLYNPQEIN